MKKFFLKTDLMLYLFFSTEGGAGVVQSVPSSFGGVRVLTHCRQQMHGPCQCIRAGVYPAAK